MLCNNKITRLYSHAGFMLTPVLLLLITCMATSCNHKFSRQDLKKIMGERFLNKVKIPEQVQLINGQPGMFTDISDTGENGQYKIIHFFTADCDKCISELNMAQKFINSDGKRANLSYFFIASGPTATFVKEAIAKSAFPLPVYFEKKYYSFKILNNLPLEDRKYNTMLVNSKNELLLFGAFFDNKKAQEYLFKTIENHI